MIVIAAKAIGTIDIADVLIENTLDGMIEAQGRLGQITWVDLSEGVARGTYWAPTNNDDLQLEANVVVIDDAVATEDEVIAATIWAHN
ncbi:hypothetical protein SEA_SKOG_28 [Gordonia phage Skog]|uniref:Uncharacterized protein n=1 Tax=Gordonia phage Skog TaxID=2704033 RepID=A0A6G6XK89_9CAUD|nr:hypothetical protein KHQ85_gp028 [Gordonia phage Skog]QIG58180.1 hypothetical protein SEA_SKOG_28 [Gordonia phage Skog]